MLRNHLEDYVGPMFMRGDFNCTLVPQLDRLFVSPPSRNDSLALGRLLGRAHLSDVFHDDMERAEKDQAVAGFHATAHTNFYTVSGGG